eukprot:3935033-Pyramimonas_sp.AAC.1
MRRIPVGFLGYDDPLLGVAAPISSHDERLVEHDAIHRVHHDAQVLCELLAVLNCQCRVIKNEAFMQILITVHKAKISRACVRGCVLLAVREKTRWASRYESALGASSGC